MTDPKTGALRKADDTQESLCKAEGEKVDTAQGAREEYHLTGSATDTLVRENADFRAQLEKAQADVAAFGITKLVRQQAQENNVRLQSGLTACERELAEARAALRDAYIILEGLRLGVEWELSPAIMDAIAIWCDRAKAVLTGAQGGAKG